MTIQQAMQARHSVRAYEDRAIEPELREKLQAELAACNEAGGLNMKLVFDEPKAFSAFMARYGKFSGVRNYVVVAGKKADDLNERAGYWGEKFVLAAQSLGLNTCWVALTYSKVSSAFTVAAGEKLCAVIAIGYGKTQGVPHRSKAMEKVTKTDGPAPDWFTAGVEAALLAPTAMNQQKFQFTLAEDKVSVRAGMGFYTKIDLGIVRYHFEAGAGREHFTWA